MTPPADPLLGTILGGRYRLLQRIGSGGVGHVYLAEALGPAAVPGRSRLAVKTLRPEHRRRRDLLARFKREAIAAASIRHPNVLEVYGPPIEGEGIPSFAMELLSGVDLGDLLGYEGALTPRRAMEIALGVAAGLAVTHEAGVVHRDIKPENIFVTHGEAGPCAVKILDYGLSYLPGDHGFGVAPSSRRTIVGTPEYMAPEQARGAAAHPSADLYSLGIVLFEMLTGRLPFEGPYPTIADAHAHAAPPPLRRGCSNEPISRGLEALVHRALAKDPRERFESAADLGQALSVLLEEEGARQTQR